MLRKIGFILGVIILGGAYPYLINHIKAFGQMDYTQWFCTYAGVGVVMLLAAMMASVRFGLPRFSGSLLVRLIAFIVMLLFIPIAVTIQLIKFIFQGGIGYIFGGGSAKPRKEKVHREAPVQKDGRRKLDRRNFELDVEHICDTCARKGRYALYSNAHNYLEQCHRINNITITPEVDFGSGTIVAHLVFDLTLLHEDAGAEICLYKKEPDLLYKKFAELITEKRQKYQGLDGEWHFDYTVKSK